MGKYPVIYTGNMSETIQISERVYLRKGNLPVRDQCNTGIIVGDEGVALVDLPEQCPDEEILEEVENYFRRKVTHLLFTHAHGDHRKGLASLHRQDFTVICGKAACEEIRKCYPQFQPDEWVIPDSGEEYIWDGIRYRFWIPEKLPAHSPWDMSIHLPEQEIVFTGDFVVPPFYIYTYSSNWENWRKAIGVFKKNHSEEWMLMGHGEPVKGREILPLQEVYISGLGKAAEEWTPAALRKILEEPSVKRSAELPESVRSLFGMSDPETVLRHIREIYESQGKYN